MTAWAWVALGYGVTATAITAYLGLLVQATVRLRNRERGRR